MVGRYYLDTAIWIDFLEDRKGYTGEPLGRFAFDLFCLLKANKNKLVITDLTIIELSMHYSMDQIKSMMLPYEDTIERIDITKEQKEEGKRISVERDIPVGDAIHAIVARDHNLILVTRDNHFRKLEDISEHFKPEDII